MRLKVSMVPSEGLSACDEITVFTFATGAAGSSSSIRHGLFLDGGPLEPVPHRKLMIDKTGIASVLFNSYCVDSESGRLSCGAQPLATSRYSDVGASGRCSERV